MKGMKQAWNAAKTARRVDGFHQRLALAMARQRWATRRRQSPRAAGVKR